MFFFVERYYMKKDVDNLPYSLLRTKLVKEIATLPPSPSDPLTSMMTEAFDHPDNMSDHKMAILVIQEAVRMAGYELECSQPSKEIFFAMSFRPLKLWPLIKDSLVTLSPEKMIHAFATSIDVSLDNPEGVRVVTQEIKYCSRYIIGSGGFALYLKVKFLLCLMMLGTFPRELPILVKLYEYRYYIGYPCPFTFQHLGVITYDD